MIYKAGECVTNIIGGGAPGYQPCPAELRERGMWGYWGKISRICYALLDDGYIENAYVNIFYADGTSSPMQSLDSEVWIGSDPPDTFKMARR